MILRFNWQIMCKPKPVSILVISAPKYKDSVCQLVFDTTGIDRKPANAAAQSHDVVGLTLSFID